VGKTQRLRLPRWRAWSPEPAEKALCAAVDGCPVYHRRVKAAWSGRTLPTGVFSFAERISSYNFPPAVGWPADPLDHSGDCTDCNALRGSHCCVSQARHGKQWGPGWL
jgi:hypothetical protein